MKRTGKVKVSKVAAKSMREAEAAMSRTVVVQVVLSARTVDLLKVLGESPAQVLALLADHAQQGVYRPGSWERPWLEQVFSSDFTDKLETDPEAPYFDRVRR